jgi:hypothetical protein
MDRAANAPLGKEKFKDNQRKAAANAALSGTQAANLVQRREDPAHKDRPRSTGRA